ncbi:hypothetical protein [Streptosporangium lutulentum]|uniref:Uncharacterized protein n=1 Tax=Streptosporangium lutulentum TaxID=1461250 RepID=A0ABT9QAF2_9ACTN|nr:hypothetical protein [Streptosporangium lutulentum]MDP9843747.1 hypothetical protein [Streptosporangium lutulentum]
MMRIETSISLREVAFHVLASGVDPVPTMLTWGWPFWMAETGA